MRNFVNVVVTDETTHPTKDGSWVMVEVATFSKADGLPTTKSVEVQWDAAYNGYFDRRNTAVGLKGIVKWEKTLTPAELLASMFEMAKSANITPPREGYESIVAQDLIASDFPVLGFFTPKCQKDKFENPVSIITMPSYIYRMAHFPAQGATSHASIYAGRGRSVRVRAYNSGKPGAAHTITVGKYSVSWVDGRVMSMTDNFEPHQRLAIEKIVNESEVVFILYILWQFADTPDFWTVKPPKVTPEDQHRNADFMEMVAEDIIASAQNARYERIS